MEVEQVDSAAPQGCPKYLKLAKGFERQLKTGVLRVGDRLPSVRQLRDEHRVSVATAVGCYLWLERQGYVRARPKSGFYVESCSACRWTCACRFRARQGASDCAHGHRPWHHSPR